MWIVSGEIKCCGSFTVLTQFPREENNKKK